LRSLNKTFIGTVFVGYLQDDGIGWNLLFVSDNKNIANLNFFKSSFNNMISTIFFSANFLNWRVVRFLVRLMAGIICDSFLNNTDQDDEAKNDSNNSRRVD